VVELQLPASVDAELRAARPVATRPSILHLAGRWEDLSRFGGYDVPRRTAAPRSATTSPEWNRAAARVFTIHSPAGPGSSRSTAARPGCFGGRRPGSRTESLAASADLAAHRVTGGR